LAPEPAAVCRPHRAEQRQRVERRDLVVVGPTLVHPGHGLRVRLVALELVAGAVEQAVRRRQERLLDWQRRFRGTRFGRRCEFLEHCARRLEILLRPERVVVAHRLAPIGEREISVDSSCLAERDRGFIELEAVQCFDAFDELGLSSRIARRRKRDGAELLPGGDQHHARGGSYGDRTSKLE
jgi:hypothetical protein